MDERRLFFAGNADASRHGSQIVEHDLDMVRSAERPAPVSRRFSRILNWLMPSDRTVGPPMRSVARELEESFPARDL